MNWKQHDNEMQIQSLEHQLEEISKNEKRLAGQLESFKDLLLELEEYFDQRADGEQFPDSPGMICNEEMGFLDRIRNKANEFHWRHVIKEDAKMGITSEWMKKKIESDPDDAEFEAGASALPQPTTAEEGEGE